MRRRRVYRDAAENESLPAKLEFEANKARAEAQHTCGYVRRPRPQFNEEIEFRRQRRIRRAYCVSAIEIRSGSVSEENRVWQAATNNRGHVFMEYRYLLSLGSNIGNRHSHLLRGVQLLGCEVVVRRVTRILETMPLSHPNYDSAGHAPYLNCVIDCETDLDAKTLYEDVIKPIEDVVGHDRSMKWQPRELDIDILFWAHNQHELFHLCEPLHVSSDRGFIVPHNEIWGRSFLLDLIEHDLQVDKNRLLSRSF